MKVVESNIEIYFSDLNKDAQEKFLEAVGVKTSDEGNYDVLPIAIAPVPEPS